MADSGYDAPSLVPLRISTEKAEPRSLFVRLVRMIRLWRRRAYERQQLARFDDRALRDLALTRADAQNELAKPFWRA
jgi:uncharacterized protein YjiS (DUF1127 family)